MNLKSFKKFFIKLDAYRQALWREFTMLASRRRAKGTRLKTITSILLIPEFLEFGRDYRPDPGKKGNLKLYEDEGNNNNFNTYSWINNNRYFYGYNYRNYNYITCYDRFNNRFSIITIPNDYQNYPVVIQPYPPVIIQTYPVNYYQTFDTTGFLSPILMLLRIAQGNCIW